MNCQYNGLICTNLEYLCNLCGDKDKEIKKLKEQIEKMKPYCKGLCKNYIKTEFMGNDCYNDVCRNCDRWELAE